MANGGWHDTDEEWRRVEAPLIRLDPYLDQFAHKYGLSFTKNHKNQPERSIAWGDNVRCLIQIYMVDQSAPAFNLWVCASQDREGSRFWKQETPCKEMQGPEMEAGLPDLLEEGKQKLDHWSLHPELLEFATKLMSSR